MSEDGDAQENEGKSVSKMLLQWPRVSLFSGEPTGKGEVTYDVWKFEVECLLKGKLYTPEAIALGVRKSVKGGASRVLMHAGAEATVNEILAKFDKVFGTVVSGETLLQQFYSEVQQEGESVATWGCRLEDILRRAQERGKVPTGAFDQMLQTKFWSNLNSERVQSALRHKLGSIKDFDALLAAAREAEQEIREFDRVRASKGKIGKVHQAIAAESDQDEGALAAVLQRLEKMETGQASAGLEAVVARLEKLEAKIEQGSAGRGRNKNRGNAAQQTIRPERNKNDEVICFKCNQPGHIAIGCRARPRPGANEQPLNGNQPL